MWAMHLQIFARTAFIYLLARETRYHDLRKGRGLKFFGGHCSFTYTWPTSDLLFFLSFFFIEECATLTTFRESEFENLLFKKTHLKQKRNTVALEKIYQCKLTTIENRECTHVQNKILIHYIIQRNNFLNTSFQDSAACNLWVNW